MFFMIDWRLTLLAILPLPFMVIVTSAIGRKNHQAFKEAQEGFSELNNFVQESVSGVKVTKSFGFQADEIQAFEKTNQMVFSKNMTSASYNALFVYGFICGAYMPISNFGPGLQKALSYLPSTYATSLIKNHMLHGVFREMERKHYPGEMVEAIRDTLDCNPVFHGNVVSVNQMIGIMLGSIAVFGIIYYIVTVSSDR